MNKRRNKKLEKDIAKLLPQGDYILNKGGMPRLYILNEIPESASDSDYLAAFLKNAAAALYPLEDSPSLELEGRGPEGDSALHCACTSGNLRAARLIIEAGLNVEVLDDMQQTPLHRASNNRYLDIIELLLSHGASPHTKDRFGYSPLEWAKQMEYADVVAILTRVKKRNTPKKDAKKK